MKTTLFAFCILAVAARADITLTQQVDQPGGKEPMLITTKVKGPMVRSDVANKVSAIIDTRTGDTLTLMHDQKMAMKIPGAALQAAKAKAMGDSSEVSKPEPTGAKETIHGFACEEYIVKNQGSTIHAWITKDIPEAAEFMKKLSELSPQTNPMAALGDNQIDGFPVRTIVDSGAMGKVTMTLLSINRDDISDKEFQTPSGYREAAMPNIPGMQGR